MHYSNISECISEDSLLSAYFRSASATDHLNLYDAHAYIRGDISQTSWHRGIRNAPGWRLN